MDRRIYLVAVFAGLALIFKPAVSGDFKKEEIKKQFSGKTVKGVHHKKEFSFTRYFSPDGSMIGVSSKKGKRTGVWVV
jgi:hypothetical protein